MFVDEAKIEVRAGKGGDGIISFRRERTKPKGGPDGGDGGNGGSVWVEVSPRMTTLYDYRRQKLFKAMPGQNGGKNERKGKSGEDLILYFPQGTHIKIFEKDNLVKKIDLVKKGTKIEIAKEGKGGHGNCWFKNSVRQAPRIRQLGTKGELKTLELELKLLANIGIIGLPNSGKSTLLSRLSHARPKIAAYPFTTLQPNLGVLEFRELGIKSKKSLVLADIPGLIEGAHEGKGLGIRFLKHIERCKALIHIIDGQSDDVVKDYQEVNNELVSYSPKLVKKKQIVVLNKIDAVNEKILLKKAKKLKKATKSTIYPISAVTGFGIKTLVLSLLDPPANA
ncbi:MAG: GTPase ObgE [Candidatus Berkelbacteria bacterium]|nr:GTPase ObgE [Candidatus Berkelbacteria bacterium]